MLAFLTPLLGLLPNFLLNGLKAWLDAKYTLAAAQEQTKQTEFTAAVSGLVAIRQAQAQVISTAMGHRVFWIPWLIAAIPAVTWYAWGMADSFWPGHLSHVSELPPQLKDYTDAIWNNLFLAGGITATGTTIAASLVKIFGAKG